MNATVFTVPSQMPQRLARALPLVVAGASVPAVSVWFSGSERAGTLGLRASILSLGGMLRPESRHR